MKALVIGATGATGKDLVNQLLGNSSYEEVHIFVRKAIGLTHAKLKVHIVDFEKPEEWKSLVIGDVAFSSMGTTLKAAGSKEAQWKVDYDYQYHFAKAASENKVPAYVLVSAYGANANAALFYNKMKGALEDAVKNLTFTKTVIFRPGMLDRDNTDRAGESISGKVIRFFNAIGLFKKYRPLPTSTLANAMIHSVQTEPDGLSIVELDKIFNFTNTKPSH